MIADHTARVKDLDPELVDAIECVLLAAVAARLTGRTNAELCRALDGIASAARNALEDHHRRMDAGSAGGEAPPF